MSWTKKEAEGWAVILRDRIPGYPVEVVRRSTSTYGLKVLPKPGEPADLNYLGNSTPLMINAEVYNAEQGHMPLPERGTVEWDNMYRKYIDYAFADLVESEKNEVKKRGRKS